MKIPFKIKLDYFFEQYKILIGFIFSLFLILFLAYGVYSIKNINLNISPSVLGVLSALLGAIVAGVLTLFGSIYVNNNQLKSKSAIYRRNVIYKPLYDELVEIRNILKEQNPYPSYVTFSRHNQTIIPHPQFSAWSRIKNDSRFLQTPDYLIDGFEELYKKIDDYMRAKPIADNEIQNKINDILHKKYDTTCTILNFGSANSSSIILKNKPKGALLKGCGFALQSGKTLSDEELLELEGIIYEECHKLNSVRLLINSYNNWIVFQDELINTLVTMIKLINMKYEKINKRY